jgi:hypothetical protein
MRLSVALLVVAAAGVVGGAWLIAWWAVGLAVIGLSGGLGAFAVLRDVPEQPAAQPTGLPEPIERYRKGA